jgi:Na+:H+ antiporter, NhaA family
VTALIWANVAPGTYEELWSTDLGPVTLGAWVSEGLMAVFFFVVGLEIKREVVQGELRHPRRALLPVLAAVGGMVVPALLYTLVNLGGDAVGGWAVPMATDIAFALGVVALLGPRVPASLKLFLLTLAIVDDIGAVAVIAVVYSDDLDLAWLALAIAGLGLLVLLQRIGFWTVPLHLVIGCGVWWATHESGVHATIAGVALGLVAPVTDDLEDRIHPWSSYVIVPLFALANAGISLSADHLGDAVTSTVTLGIVLGLVVGKPAGIVGATWLAQRRGWAERPPGVAWDRLLGVGALAGIGFTVSLFVTNLAFADQPDVIEEAKIGILAASVLATAAGALVLSLRRTG